MNNSLVSVIIPVFNTAPYLVEALDSVINQTYLNLEIIIIDDGSTDGSGAICDEYAERDGRIRVIHQDNRGLSAARNSGLDAMTGEAVAFLDSDDAYHKDFILNMWSALNRENADLVICRFTTYSVAKKTTCSIEVSSSNLLGKGLYDRADALRALVGKRINSYVWNKLYSRELWYKLRFPVGHVFEDLDTTYRVFDKCKKVYILDESLYLKRSHVGSISNTYTKNNIEDWYLACSHLDSFINENTPELFSTEHLVRYRQKMIQSLIEYFVQYIRKANNKDEEFIKTLRNRIVETERSTGLGNCGLRKRIYYWMICNSPEFLSFILSAF